MRTLLVVGLVLVISALSTCTIVLQDVIEWEKQMLTEATK